MDTDAADTIVLHPGTTTTTTTTAIRTTTTRTTKTTTMHARPDCHAIRDRIVPDLDTHHGLPTSIAGFQLLQLGHQKDDNLRRSPQEGDHSQKVSFFRDAQRQMTSESRCTPLSQRELS
eukprot:42695-Pelagomonas_calceolata.AAC.3